MYDVVFVTPNFYGHVREEPVGTLLLTTILHRAGITAKILPFYHFGLIENFDDFLENAVRSILSLNPKIVSFYTRCDTYHISIKIAQQLKKNANNIYIVFGGPQADISAKDTLLVIPEVDFVCCGEGETTVVPLFSSLIDQTPDLSICGLCFRRGDEIITNPRPDLIADLDSLPAIDFSFVDFMHNQQDAAKHELFPIDVGRGCPFSCTFCSTKSFWGGKYRLKSAERIIAEIEQAHNTFGVNLFNFEHDMFTMNRAKVIDICKKLKKLEFSINWRCSARIDCLDQELIDVMVDAGMIQLFVGIETGSPRMQKITKKNLALNNVYKTLSYISSKGIFVTASFIFGFPEETEDDFSQTIGLMTKICRLPKIEVQYHLCTLFSGTELAEKYIDQIEFVSIPSNITGEFAIQPCRDLITAHPRLFPHYFEYKTPFREQIKYFPQFFDCWNLMPVVYEYVATNYYQNNYCKMLYDFSEKNQASLVAGKTQFNLLQEDKFLDMFSHDEHSSLFKEISRFSLWLHNPDAASLDVFHFDVKAFLNNVDIANIGSSLTIVSYTKDTKGEKTLVLRQQNQP